MTVLSPLRDQLLGLRRRTLAVLAGRSVDEMVDAGLVALVADVQAALAAIDEEADCGT